MQACRCVCVFAFYSFLSALSTQVARHDTANVTEAHDTTCLLASPLYCNHLSLSSSLPTQHTCTHLSQHAPPLLCVETVLITVRQQNSEGRGSGTRVEGGWNSVASVFCHFPMTWIAAEVRSYCKDSREIFGVSGVCQIVSGPMEWNESRGGEGGSPSGSWGSGQGRNLQKETWEQAVPNRAGVWSVLTGAHCPWKMQKQ